MQSFKEVIKEIRDKLPAKQEVLGAYTLLKFTFGDWLKVEKTPLGWNISCFYTMALLPSEIKEEYLETFYKQINLMFKKLARGIGEVAFGKFVLEDLNPHPPFGDVLVWKISVYPKQKIVERRRLILFMCSKFFAYKHQIGESLFGVKEIKRFLTNSPNRFGLKVDLDALEKCPEFMGCKSYLVNKKYITSDYLPLKPLRQVIKVIREFYAPKEVCPVCGEEFPKKRKDTVVCPKRQCQQKKHRVKEKVWRWQCFEGLNLTKEKVVKRLKDLEAKGLNAGKRLKPIPVHDWHRLVEVILKEIKADREKDRPLIRLKPQD